jgi:alpha-L-fucosidase
VHVFDWPEDGKLVLPGLKTTPSKISMMGSSLRSFRCVFTEDRTGNCQAVIEVPKEPIDPLDSVIVLDFIEPPQVEPLVLRPGKNGALELPSSFAEIRAKHGQRARPMSEKGRTYIGNWSNPRDVAAWSFTIPKAETYSVAIDARPASTKAVGQRVAVRVGKKRLVGKITKDGVEIKGKLPIKAGGQTLTVRLLDAKRTGPSIIDLFGVTLRPAPADAPKKK